jgi:hypothetical protein
MEIRIGIERNAGWALKQLGYTHRRHPNDFVKEDANGRFHAKITGTHVKIHYDVDVDGKHVASIPLPAHMRQELARVQRYVDKQRTKK